MAKAKKAPKSAVIELMELVWANANRATGHSWERKNHALRGALKMAIGAGFEFAARDLDVIANDFGFGYWCGESDEWIYGLAIQVGNMSAIHEFERWKSREPFIAENLDISERSGSYVHLTGKRKKERLHVGCTFMWQGHKVVVNSFAKDSAYVNVGAYKKVKSTNGRYSSYSDKLERRFKITREELLTGRAEDRERRRLRERLEKACVNGTQAKIVRALGGQRIVRGAFLNDVPIDRLRKVADKYAPVPPRPKRREWATITEEHIEQARLAGAGCQLRRYPVGTSMAKIPPAHWEWIRQNMPEFAAKYDPDRIIVQVPQPSPSSGDESP